MQLNIDAPDSLVGDSEIDIKNIHDYLCKLVDELDILLQRIDD